MGVVAVVVVIDIVDDNEASPSLKGETRDCILNESIVLRESAYFCF